MSEKRNKLNAEIKRARVSGMLRRGLTMSAVAKRTGFSYKHVKQIAEQEGLAKTKDSD